MKWFSKKGDRDDRMKQPTAPGRGQDIDELMRSLHPVPAEDEDLARMMQDLREANRLVAENDGLQEAMSSMLSGEPTRPAPPSLDEMLERVRGGGLSYLMSPPADFDADASGLFMSGVAGSMTGDDASSLSKFEEVLEVARSTGHQRAEARCLYNAGLAHHKLGDAPRAIETLLEGKALAEKIADELGREARKLQRFAEERSSDDARVDVFGTPDIEQQLQAMFLEALAIVYEADAQETRAAETRTELEHLRRGGS